MGAGSSIGQTVFAAAFLFVRVAGSPVADRLRRKTLTILNLCVEAGGLIVVATAHTLTVAVVGTAITGAGVGLMFPAIVALTLSRVGGERAVQVSTPARAASAGIELLIASTPLEEVGERAE